jgi:hypothetical protein
MVWGGTHCFKCLVLARGFVTTKDGWMYGLMDGWMDVFLHK